MSETDVPTVLVGDDETVVAEAYALWLAEDYDVRIANDGQEAIEKMDDDVDVVLLDRRMPQLSGDEALEEIRDRGYDCQVAMITAIDPDFDIVEMEFDDYLTKPITREDIERTVEDLVTLSERDEAVNEEFSRAKKQAALESRKNEEQLDRDEQYERLRQQWEELRDDGDDSLEEMDVETLETVLESFPDEEES